MSVQEAHYRDEGCEISPSCLNCPLPRCRHDIPTGIRGLKQAAKDFSVWNAMQAEGLTVKEAAVRFSVSKRTVFRIMRRCREAGAA